MTEKKKSEVIVNMKSIFLSLLLVVCFSSLVWSESELEQKSVPASSTNIIGKWEMIYQKNGNLIPNDDPYVYPYQRFQFFSDGYVKNIAINNPFTENELAIWEAAPKSSKYELAKSGVLLITASGSVTLIIISVITEDMSQSLRPDAPKLRKGDLILSYLTQDKILYLQRYLRKLN